MTCHHCRKPFPWLLFGRYCMTCWRKAPLRRRPRPRHAGVSAPARQGSQRRHVSGTLAAVARTQKG